MRILVTGVKGQLGHDVMNELAKRGHTGIGVDVEEMDITDAKKVNEVIRASEVEAVIHCARIPLWMLRKIRWSFAVDQCGREPRILQRFVKNWILR